MPYIGALARFHSAHSTYPAALADLKDTPPASTPLTYLRHEDGLGYTLSRRLGWDPSLVFGFGGGQGSWTFVPGDGSPEKTIRLSP